MRLVEVIVLAAVGCAAPRRAPVEPDVTPAAAAAVQRAMPLLQSSAVKWTELRGCMSCHHGTLGLWAVETARRAHLPVDEPLARRLADAYHPMPDKVFFLDAIFDPQISVPYIELGELVAKGAIDPRTLYIVAGRQGADGGWHAESHRPPLETSDFAATALSLRALALASPGHRSAEIAARIARGRQWLAAAKPRETEDAVMQLWGLLWSDAACHDGCADDGIRLVRQQNPDGGWAQLRGHASDAYATGQVLVVLHATGMRVTNSIYRRGIAWLLAHQQRDGTWQVWTRRRAPGLPYFETGFPYGLNQFISYAATAWATIALAAAISPDATDFLTAVPSQHEHELASAGEAAIWGTAADLAAKLADGDDRGIGDIPLVLLAAHDADMLRLVLDHGADPNTKGPRGMTPLMIAAVYSGAKPAVDLLVARGADVHARDKSGDTALTYAVRAGDRAKVDALLAAGADLEAVDGFGWTVARVAAMKNDAAMLTYLLGRGAKLTARSVDIGDTALINAVATGTRSAFDVLVAAGTPIDEVDFDGRTALWWAAISDFGSSDEVVALLAHGADPQHAAKDGSTPLSVARRYRPDVVPLLERAMR